ncbi:MAG TPA: hypothetical protein VE131_13435, partial [Terriglobales bacterium]|nr:hypothetical protein [Terriglobales bacterium]
PASLKSSRDLGAVIQSFHARHRELYTFHLPERQIEFLTFWLKATAARPLNLKMMAMKRGTKTPKGAFKRQRRCLFGKNWVETSCFDGERLLAGNTIPGPAIVEEAATTVVIPPGFTCSVEPSGGYLLTRIPK